MTIDLRPVAGSDRNRLLDWRNADHVRAVSVDAEPITEQQHDVWFARIAAGEPDGEMRVVEVDQRPVGVVRVERVDRDNRVGGWACHLGDRAVPPGLGAALPVFGLAMGFDAWGLRRMSAEVLSSNANMRGVHRRLRITEEGVRRAALLRSGEVVDVHEYGVLADEWPEIRSRLLRALPGSVRDDVAGVFEAMVSPAGSEASGVYSGGDDDAR